MDRLLELLAQAENLADLNDEELGQLLTDIRAASEEVLEGDVSDEDLENLDRAAGVVSAIEGEQSARAEADEERVARAQSIRERILGQSDTGDGEGEGDESAEEGEGEGTEAESTDAAEEEDTDEASTPEAVAAAAAAARTPRVPARRGVSRVAARRPAGMERRPAAPASTEGMALVAAANLPNIPAGQPLDTPDRLARAFMAAYEMSRGYRGPRVKVPVARIGSEDPAALYGEERTLRLGSPEENTRKIEALTSQQAITAAGGICAPVNVNYDMPTIGSDARPFRDDALTRFGADRGGARTFPVPTLDQITTGDSGAITVWSVDNDEDPGSDGPATKPCLTVTCPDPEESLVEAITRCLEFGNFRARFFPEQVRAWLDLAAVAHARYAETRLLTAVGTGSTQVTSGQLLGASIDVLTTLTRAVAAFRSRWRLERGVRLRWAAPTWLLDLMRVDIMRRMDGTVEEKLGVAEAEIQSWIAANNVNVTWFLDGESGQVFGAQGDGPLLGWPSTVVTYLYPEGSWLFLDGGELDLGIVRDSTLNSTNDYQVFAETFEGTHFHGIESYRLTMDLCPDGSVAGSVDINPCSVGS